MTFNSSSQHMTLSRGAPERNLKVQGVFGTRSSERSERGWLPGGQTDSPASFQSVVALGCHLPF